VTLSRVVVVALAFGASTAFAQPAPTPAPLPTAAAPAPAAPAPQSVSVDSGAFGAPAVPLPAMPDAVKVEPAALAWVNPLHRAAETPARSLDHAPPEDWETRTSLLAAVHLPENGRPTEAVAVRPPLAALAPALATLAQKWVFTPAKKGGAPVATWATYGIDLQVDVEKATFTAFTLTPVGAGDPLPPLVPEAAGESWITRWPKDPQPPDGTVSIEDVEILPAPEKTHWSFDSGRARSHVTALVEVGANGVVSKIAPTGSFDEPLVIAWLRRSATRWHVTPAMAGGKPIATWMTLDATLEYTVNSAKEKGKRVLKKNLRGAPSPE
jgi:hypothetical protein